MISRLVVIFSLFIPGEKKKLKTEVYNLFDFKSRVLLLERNLT